jgi:hypothetical protein
VNNKAYSNRAWLIPRVSARMHTTEQVELVPLGFPIYRPPTKRDAMIAQANGPIAEPSARHLQSGKAETACLAPAKPWRRTARRASPCQRGQR